MVHIFVQARMINAATLIERFTNVGLAGPFFMHGEALYGFGGRGAFFGTAMLVIMIALVMTVAFIAYVLVEKPCQRLSKRFAANRFGQFNSMQGKLIEAGAAAKV